MIPTAHSASDTRLEEKGDWIASQFFSQADLRMQPEEYVARHAHAIGGFSFDLFRFDDPDLGAWVRRVGELLASEDEVNRCRERFLSREELADALRQDSEGL